MRGLTSPERPLHFGQILVAVMHTLGVGRRGRPIGFDHVTPVQAGALNGRVFVPPQSDRPFPHVGREPGLHPEFRDPVVHPLPRLVRAGPRVGLQVGVCQEILLKYS